MQTDMPRIAKVSAEGPTLLAVTWKSGNTALVELAGWIATGGEILAPLRDPATFQRAALGDYGASVAWDDDDLAIDAVHLGQLAEEQRPFVQTDLQAWQEALTLSNQEAADFLDVTLSTWHTYKNGSARIPSTVAMLCRASRRDPILMQAHYRPRSTGRPDTLHIADRILLLVATRPDLTEAEMAREIFGDDGVQQQVNPTCRLLVARGEIVRHGSGGRGSPFTYRLPEKKRA